MTTGTKVILGSIGLLTVAAIVYGKRTLDKFSFRIAAYGLPRISNGVLTLPIHLEFFNPTVLTIPINTLKLDTYLIQINGTRKQVASVNQPLTIYPGTGTQILYVSTDLQAITGEDFFTTLATLLKLKFTFETIVTVSATGYDTLTDSIINEIDLASILQS